MSIPTDKDLKKIIGRLKEAFKSSGGISEDEVNAIVQQKIDAALAKAEENMYKSLKVQVLTGPTALNQTYTVQKDGVYIFRANYFVVTASGSIIFVVNGSQTGVKGLSTTNWAEYTVTYELKEGDTFLVRPSDNNVPNNLNNFSTSVYYMGRLRLTGN